MWLILMLLAIFATTIGGTVGLGGGIIVRPALTFMGFDPVTVGVLSGFTVLAMATSSTLKYTIRKQVHKEVFFMAFGAFFGGLIGNYITKYLAHNSYDLTTIQTVVYVTMLISIVYVLRIRDKVTKHHLESRILMVVLGVFLGILKGFLSIGGGPLSIFFLVWLFGLSLKEAAVNSVMIILFSQVSKLFFIETGIPYDYLLYMIPAGLAGGFIAASIHNRLSERTISILLNTLIISMIVLNIGYLITG